MQQHNPTAPQPLNLTLQQNSSFTSVRNHPVQILLGTVPQNVSLLSSLQLAVPPAPSALPTQPPTEADSTSARQSHMMFLAHVLVGKYTLGNTQYRRPPPIDPFDAYGKAYDSCVNCVKEPTIFVIFDSAQIYPEYLVEYTPVAGVPVYR